MLRQVCEVIDCSKHESLHLCPKQCGVENGHDHHHEEENESGKNKRIKELSRMSTNRGKILSYFPDLDALFD